MGGGVRQDAPLLHGISECAGQHGDDPADRGGAATSGDQVRDEVPDVVVVELLEWHRTDRGHDVQPDVPVVVEPCGGLESVALLGGPVGQVLTGGELAVLGDAHVAAPDHRV